MRGYEQTATRRRAGRVGVGLAVSLLADLALGGWVAYALVGPKPPATVPPAPGTAPIDAAEKVVALGRVQPVGGVVSVFGPPGDRVVELKVGLGSVVKKGDRLAVLSGEAEREEAIKALTAQVAEAELLVAAIADSRTAQLDSLTAETARATQTGAADLAVADTKIKGLDAQLEQAQRERDRLARVEANGVAVSAQEKEQVTLAYTRAKLEKDAAVAQRESAKTALDTAPVTAAAKKQAVEAEARRAAAQVPLKSLQASLRAAELKRDKAILEAPVAGRVVRVMTSDGDTLTNQPVLQIADTASMAVIAEVYETDVARLRGWLRKAGPKGVTAAVDARVVDGDPKAKPLQGTVTVDRVSPAIARNAVFALGPREDADRRVVEVEIRLDKGSSAAVADFIGLQVRATISPP